jgi:hypothetical protein
MEEILLKLFGLQQDALRGASVKSIWVDMFPQEPQQQH